MSGARPSPRRQAEDRRAPGEAPAIGAVVRHDAPEPIGNSPDFIGYKAAGPLAAGCILVQASRVDVWIGLLAMVCLIALVRFTLDASLAVVAAGTIGLLLGESLPVPPPSPSSSPTCWAKRRSSRHDSTGEVGSFRGAPP